MFLLLLRAKVTRSPLPQKREPSVFETRGNAAWLFAATHGRPYVTVLHLQQQESGAKRPSGEDQSVGGERLSGQARGIRPLAFPLWFVSRVADRISSAISWFELFYLAPRQDPGTQPLGLREIIVVERVLGPVVAPYVALADQAAGVARALASLYIPILSTNWLARSRFFTLVAEGNGQLGRLQVESQPFGGFPELLYLRHLVVRFLFARVPLGAKHLLDPVVVGVEVGPGDRPVLMAAVPEILLDKPLLVLADQDVRVDQGAAAQAAADHRSQLVERPDVVHPVQTLAGVPDVLLHPLRGARKLAGRIRLSPLQDAHVKARLREPVRRHRPAETGTDDYRVEVRIARTLVHTTRSPPVHHLSR